MFHSGRIRLWYREQTHPLKRRLQTKLLWLRKSAFETNIRRSANKNSSVSLSMRAQVLIGFFHLASSAQIDVQSNILF